MDHALIARTLATAGHIFVPAAELRPQLERHGALSDWDAFTASWSGMPVDAYMADRGRYRRRRYANYRVERGAISRLPHRAHYQSLEYNPVHGGIERWFEPMTEDVGGGASMQAVLRFAGAVFDVLQPAACWFVEVHQFRIEALPGEPGKPTPEGVHRDGVDYVLVLMVRRHNIASGTTTIHAPDGTRLGSFTLMQPFDATLVDDRRVFHGVTPVEAIDAAQPAYRDVLVVTFRKSGEIQLRGPCAAG